MSDETTGRTISVPLTLTVPTILLLGWMNRLAVAIAAETDATRPAMAKVLGEIRAEIGRVFPAELQMENRE